MGSIKSQVNDMHKALLGDYHGDTGTIHMMRDACDDVRVMKGNFEDLKKKVDSLQQSDIKQKTVIATAGGVLGAFCGSIVSSVKSLFSN